LQGTGKRREGWKRPRRSGDSGGRNGDGSVRDGDIGAGEWTEAQVRGYTDGARNRDEVRNEDSDMDEEGTRYANGARDENTAREKDGGARERNVSQGRE